MPAPVGNLRLVGEHRARQPKSRSLFSVLSALGALLAALYSGYAALDSVKERWYIFDPVELQALSQQAISANPNNTRGIVNDIVASLRTTHPAYAINQDEEWVFNNAGGAMGAMYIIHASITEYLIVFGTSLGTEGHTGRHTADDYFTILEGEQWAMSRTNPLQKEVYPAGSQHHLRRGDVKQYKMHEGCFALELAQGWIPPMMPFGLADILFSTLDFGCFFDTVRVTAREMLKNLVNGKI